jgi:uncharacterized membrane protein
MSHLHLPHPQRLSESTRTVREAFWVAVLGIVTTFAFFLLLGAVTPAQAGVATGVVAALALAYVLHAWHAGRHADGRDPRMIRARERRGF